MNVKKFPPFFSIDEGSSTDPRVPIHLDSHDNMNLAWFEDSSDTLTVRLNGTLAHGTSASFKISGLKVPTGGIDVAQSQAIACGAVASTTMHQSLSTNTFDFKTPVRGNKTPKTPKTDSKPTAVDDVNTKMNIEKIKELQMA